jgi:hypothetical protein
MRRIIAALLLLLACVGSTQAGTITLTPTGIADGFTLSLYATGNGNYSFLSAAPLNGSPGNLVVADNYHGMLRKYADVDGQTYGSALASVGFGNPGSPYSVANAGGQTYATRHGDSIYRVSSTLGTTPLTVTGNFVSFAPWYGMAGNPVTGHLLVSGTTLNGFGIFDIDPLTGVGTIVNNSGSLAYDGISVSPDGTKVYGEINGGILGFNILTHAQVFSSFNGHNPDGTGVIAGGIYDGYVIANNNDGTVGLIAPGGGAQTIIASGGNRGDFTSPDTNNGTLFLADESDFMYRLGAPGGSFGGTAPEPATLTMLGMGIATMAGYGWRRRKLTTDSPTQA